MRAEEESLKPGLSEEVADPPATAAGAPPLPALLLSLTKPRLALLSTLTGVAGYLAAPVAVSWTAFLALFAVLFLSAAGALALNQYMERDADGKMARTRERALPAGQLRAPAALATGLGALGLSLLLSVSLFPFLTTGLVLATVGIYLLVYTPLKQVTPWCTHLGAIPGALPPLIGWSAATGGAGGLGFWLFLIVLLWQMPHFFAIAWMCREDYAAGGMKMLSVTHGGGRRLVAENYLYLGLLFPVSLAPVLLGQVGWVYGAIALLLNAVFLREGVRFARGVRGEGGRNRLFTFSLLYLPLLLVALLLNRVG